jgi:multiple sugar transport system permease protein
MDMKGLHLKGIIIIILLVSLMIFTLFPIYYLFLTSIKPANAMFSVPPKFFFSANFSGYLDIVVKQKYFRYYVNSIIVSVFSAMLCLVFGTLGAFAFSTFRFVGQKALFLIILITRMYPPVTTLIPVFFAIKYFGLNDTRTGLILVFAGFQIPFIIWVMKAFFDEIPKTLIESASLDGASLITTFWKIILPLSLPGLLASGILVFVLNWNEFLFALVLTSTKAKTAPVAVASFVETEGMLQWGTISVLGILTIFPIIIIVLFLRKYLMKGLLVGAVKG